MSSFYIDIQPGFQNDFLRSEADIVIGGGAAGTGKTFSLLIDYFLDVNSKNWGGVIFRRTYPQIKMEGGLWDSTMKLYPKMGFNPRENDLIWTYHNGNKLQMRHLQHEKNILDYQGAEIPWIAFDELTHFSKKMFFYLLSRNRGIVEKKPRIRATCNPDPDSWVAEFIEWWIDTDTGFPIEDRAGQIRYLLLDGDNYIWGSSIDEIRKKGAYLLDPIIEKSKIDPKDLIKSVTFIPGSIYQNRKLLEANPGYLANLLAQDDQTKAQLLDGNWKVKIGPEELLEYYAFRDIFNIDLTAQSRSTYLTADIALQGSDKFIIGVWNGLKLIEIKIVPKSKGNDVIEDIKYYQKRYLIPNRNIVVDADGVGSFIGGFINGIVEFHNGGKPLKGENFRNLKTQMYYKLGEYISDNKIYVSEDIQNKMYDEKKTIKQRMMEERKAIKKDKIDYDGKLQILPKQEMKVILGGTSPDIMDMIMMRMYFEVQPERKGPKRRN